MANAASIAGWLLNIATSNLPAERQVWGRAMSAEFETLQSGRFAWAFGCFLTMLAWRFRSDWRFVVVVTAAGGSMDFAMYLLATVAPQFLTHTTAYYYWLAFPALVCAGFAVWRPRYAFASAVAVVLVREVEGLAIMAFVLRAPIGHGLHIMDGPPVVGLSAILGWCMLGAAVGRRLAAGRNVAS